MAFGLAGGLTLAGLLTLSTGCSNRGSVAREDVLIPREDTVAEQFTVAQRQENDARGIFDQDVRREELMKAIYAYETVEERFPDDQFHTPAAAVISAELYAEIDEHAQALQKYQSVLERWPEDEEARVAALMGMGRSLDDLRRPDEAQTYYKMLIDEYQSSTKPEVRTLVERARQRYRQIRPRI